ncbi:MAG: uracil phosphoribosyltransferase [Firmicutes bacterium]|nr:uracil phosphoribosyltransferase [Bacillota bacterium]
MDIKNNLKSKLDNKKIVIANNDQFINNHLDNTRDRSLDSSKFRESFSVVGRHVLQTAIASIMYKTKTEIPPIFIPVLRAGVAGLDLDLQKLTSAQTYFVGMHRNILDAKLAPTVYYDDIPQCENQNQQVFVIDPMLATGNSLLYVVYRLQELGYKNITIVSILSAPEGILNIQQTLQDIAPELDIKIIVAAIDDCLDGKDYIVPGLGDAGDRYFGENKLEWLVTFANDLRLIANDCQYRDIMSALTDVHHAKIIREYK